jgi:hypothetical protein
MVLADPGFVVTEFVEVIDELEIPLHGHRRVFIDRVEGRQENSIPPSTC